MRHGTHRAGRIARAQRRAQIHDGLRVRADARLRGARPGLAPQCREHRGGPGIAGNAEHAREHALDVAVQNGMPLTPGQRENGAGRGTADAGQRFDGLEA